MTDLLQQLIDLYEQLEDEDGVPPEASAILQGAIDELEILVNESVPA